MNSEFVPIFDRVVIKRDKSALQRRADRANIITPDKVKSSYQSSEGTLVRVGEDCCELVKGLVGKRILFAKYSGDDLPDNWYGDDDQYVLAHEGDIFGEIV